jgi:hypothetical protein
MQGSIAAKFQLINLTNKEDTISVDILNSNALLKIYTHEKLPKTSHVPG